MEKKDSSRYYQYILMYGCYYFALAIFSVLISVYLMDKGLNAVRVSLVVSASYLMSMVIQPVIGIWQDKGNKKKITVLLLVLSALFGIMFLINRAFIWMLIFYGVTITLLNAANPYIEKVATTSLNSTYIPMLYQQAGISVSATSTILFIGTLMELPIIFFAYAYMNRFTGKQRLMAVVCILVMQFSAIVSPRYQMSALTLVSALSRNLITIVIQNIGGTVLDLLTVNALYMMLAGLSLLGLALTFCFKTPKEQSNMSF